MGRDTEEELRHLRTHDFGPSGQDPPACRAEPMIELLASSASGAEHASSLDPSAGRTQEQVVGCRHHAAEHPAWGHHCRVDLPGSAAHDKAVNLYTSE